MSYFEKRTHEDIIDEIFENVKEGYDTSLIILNYATFLYSESNDENISIHDWLKRINLEIELKSSKELS